MFLVTKLSSPSLAETNCAFFKKTFRSSKYALIKTAKASAVFKISIDSAIETESHVGLNTIQRLALGAELGMQVEISFIEDIVDPIQSVTFLVTPVTKKLKQFDIDDDMFANIKLTFENLPVMLQQSLIFQSKLNFLCTKISNPGTITNQTEIEMLTTDPSINIHVALASGPLFNGNFNFLELGIGGLDKQFEIVFRRAFASRLIPEKVLKNLGINHVRGILLYGPPGCGKTLIARQIGKILNCEEPKIVNGPELFSGLVGASERNVRNLFEAAIADKNGRKLHLIICDEFDSVARQRGSIEGDAGSNDKVVNQFLTMIDGPNALSNVLLICMTNRKDLIDEALLRPGRLELHIEVCLPDEKGRQDILKIHTGKMSTAGYLDSNVNLQDLAERTINYTGAELESVVRNAASFSISKHIDPNNLSNVKGITPVLAQTDFLKAIAETKPQFGIISPILDVLCATPLEMYSTYFRSLYDSLKENVENIKKNNLFSIMLYGHRQVGKTKLIAHIAKESGYSCVRFINSEELIMKQPRADLYLYETFKAGLSVDSFLLVLDSVENLVEYCSVGKYVNNKMLQMILTLLDKAVTNRTCIILTSSNVDLMSSLDIRCSRTLSLFDRENENGEMVSFVFQNRKMYGSKENKP